MRQPPPSPPSPPHQNLIGMSSLTLASTASGGNGIGTSVCVIVMAMFLCGRTFEVIGNLCHRTQSTTLSQLWESCGFSSGWWLDAMLVGYALSCCAVYVPFLSSVVISLLRSGVVSVVVGGRAPLVAPPNLPPQCCCCPCSLTPFYSAATTASDPLPSLPSTAGVPANYLLPSVIKTVLW